MLKPMMENLLSRDVETGALIPLLAERWEVLDGGRAWTFHLRKGVPFHGGQGEVTAEDVTYTFAAIAKEGSANGLAPEFRLIQSMEIEDPSTITIRFTKPFVTFGNRVTQGLFASSAFIHSKRYRDTVGDEGADRHPIGTGRPLPASPTNTKPPAAQRAEGVFSLPPRGSNAPPLIFLLPTSPPLLHPP